MARPEKQRATPKQRRRHPRDTTRVSHRWGALLKIFFLTTIDPRARNENFFVIYPLLICKRVFIFTPSTFSALFLPPSRLLDATRRLVGHLPNRPFRYRGLGLFSSSFWSMIFRRPCRGFPDLVRGMTAAVPVWSLLSLRAWAMGEPTHRRPSFTLSHFPGKGVLWHHAGSRGTFRLSRRYAYSSPVSSFALSGNRRP